MRIPQIAILACTSVLALAAADKAFAYRPFDGTDAAVAERGDLEIEFGPARYLREGSERTLIAPDLVLNYGLTDRLEAVLEGEVAHRLSGEDHQSRLVGGGAFLKGVLREGSLQDKPGPSVATELGVLLPGINDEHGVGGSVAAIVSHRFQSLTLHFNAAFILTREQHKDVFLSAIAEGPRNWPVRPVAEIMQERDFGGATTTAGLIGAIWQVGEKLAVDGALRYGRVDGHVLQEVRAGLTFAFSAR